MRRYLLLFIIMLMPAHAFLDSLSDSDSITTDTVSGLCSDTYVLIQYSVDDEIVGVETVETDDGEFEVEFTPDDEDTYTIFASCDGDVDSLSVCYGDCDDGDDESDEESDSDECEEYLDCGDWGECIDGERVRDCVYACSGETTSTYTDCTDTSTTLEDDTGSVNETCSESWSCRQWDECTNGVEERECYDYNECGTEELKPDTTQSCTVEEESVVIVEETESYTVPSTPTPVTYEEPTTETVYVPVEPEIVTVPAQTIDYKNFAIVGGIIMSVIIFIALSVMVVMHYMNAHASSSNDDEMIEFVKQERRAGIDEEQIRASLKESGWHKDEIQHALDDTKDAVPEKPVQENIAREGFEPPTSGL